MLSTQLLSIFIKTQSIKTFLKNNLFLVVLIWFSLTNVNLFSQELGTQLNDTIKAKTPPQALIKQDTTVVSVDTVIQPKEMLEYVIEHTADSLIKQDFIKKRIYLFKNAQLVYGDITLKAGYIEIDNNTNTVIAKGIKDSIGNYVQLPEFTQGGQSSTQDSIVYNFNSEKAKIHNLQTEQQGLIIRGNESKKYNDSVIFIRDIKITSSKKEKPDYYIRVNKAKFIKNKKLVAGPSQLVIADVPTPAVLPFAYVPLSKGRTSGFLMPTWGENNNQGYFLQNGGYYFVVNDNMDLAVLGDIYTNGSWGLRLESGYAKRYRYSGRFNFRYENLINSLKGFSDYRKASNYNITWSHSQDQKASPNSRFSASVNLGSSKYYKQSYNEYNNNSFLNNTLSSSISYQKNFVGTPFNMSLSATHSQNTNTEQITMTLPSLQVNMDRIYPFAGKNGVKRNALQKTGLTYSMRGENRINTTDEEFFKPEMFEKAQSGIQHNLALNTNMKALKYFTISPSVNYKEVWAFKKLQYEFDNIENAVVKDTVNQFNAFREYNAAVSLGTTVYGMFNFKKGNIEAIRHTVRPSISYSYRPDFSYYNEIYQASEDPTDLEEYSPFIGVFGRPGSGLANSLNFSVQNNLEAKLRKKDSTQKEAKKIILLNNLNFNTSYNMAADSLKWSPVGVSAGTRMFNNKLSLNARATLDPYAIDGTGRKINKFNVDNGGSLFRLTQAGFTMNYSISSSDGKKKENKNEKYNQANNSDGIFGEDLNVSNRLGSDEGGEDEGVKTADLYRSTIPWNIKFAYALNYTNSRRQSEISTNSLMFSGDVELTPKWAVGFSSGYDFKLNGFTYTQLRFSRDLDSWKLNFNWSPFGDRKTYYFFIGVKSSMLSDLKYDKRQVPDRRLF